MGSSVYLPYGLPAFGTLLQLGGIGPGAGFGPHDLSGDASNPPIVVSESSAFVNIDGFFQGYRAFDGSAYYPNVWTGTGAQFTGGTDWLKIDLGTAQPIASYALQNSDSGLMARMPSAWTLQGSTDGVTWVTIDTRTSQSGWSDLETRTYACAAPGAYRYLLLNITANNGDPQFNQIAEIYLYGYTSIANIGDLDETGISLDDADVTSHTQGFPWHALVPCLVNPGEITLPLYFIPYNIVGDAGSGSPGGLIDVATARQMRNWRIQFPDADESAWYFSGFIRKYALKAPVKGVLTMDAALALSGEVTFD